MKAIYAQIAIALPVDGLYTYQIPSKMRLEIGHAVLVPFGNRKIAGYIISFADSSPVKKTRYIERLLDPSPAFDPGMLPFFRWAAKYYLCGLGEVISTALPKSFRSKSIRVYVATEAGIDALASSTVSDRNQSMVLREVISKPGRTIKGLQKIFYGELEAPVFRKALNTLSKEKWIRCEEKENKGPQSMIKTVELTSRRGARPSIRGARMQAALNLLEDAGGMMDLQDLIALEGPTIRGALKRLEQKNMVKFDKREDRSGSTLAYLHSSGKAHKANPEQKERTGCHLSGKSHHLSSSWCNGVRKD